MFKNLPLYVTSRVYDNHQLTFPEEVKKLKNSILEGDVPSSNFFNVNHDKIYFFEKPDSNFSNGKIIFGYCNNPYEGESSLRENFFRRYTIENLVSDFVKAGFEDVSDLFWFPSNSKLGYDLEREQKESYKLMFKRREWILQSLANLDLVFRNEKEDSQLQRLLEMPSIKNMEPEFYSRLRLAPNHYLSREDATHSFSQLSTFRKSSEEKNRIVLTAKFGIPYFLYLKRGESYEQIKDILETDGFREFNRIDLNEGLSDL